MVTYIGRDEFLKGQPRSHHKGLATALTNFIVPPTYVYSVSPQTTKFGAVTHMGRGVFWVNSHAIAYCMCRAVCHQQAHHSSL